jgi:ABC-type spermidine/putrescine transport system permease subunit II
MQEAMSMLMLICAALASLALGVLLAYGVCRAAFAKLQQHAGQVAAQRAKAQIVPAVPQADS